MDALTVVAVRGGIDESIHRVSLAVADPAGRLVAQAGDSGLLTFWRSAAKPFQLWPLVADGGITRFGLDAEMLALACGSHNAEPNHRETTERWLRAIDLTESALACGGHPSLSSRIAAQMIRDEVEASPIWSNCSGKHAGMLALATLHGWPIEGYERRPHPVQESIAASIARWSGIPEEALVWGVDGCTAAAVATPLHAMATAWARLGASDDPSLRIIRDAMLAAPGMVAGADRFDTLVMQAFPGTVIVKVGAEGVYGATIPSLGLGVALKVHDGDTKASAVAFLAVLEELIRGQITPIEPLADRLTPWLNPVIANTRGERVGEMVVRGTPHFMNSGEHR